MFRRIEHQNCLFLLSLVWFLQLPISSQSFWTVWRPIKYSDRDEPGHFLVEIFTCVLDQILLTLAGVYIISIGREKHILFRSTVFQWQCFFVNSISFFGLRSDSNSFFQEIPPTSPVSRSRRFIWSTDGFAPFSRKDCYANIICWIMRIFLSILGQSVHFHELLYFGFFLFTRHRFSCRMFFEILHRFENHLENHCFRNLRLLRSPDKTYHPNALVQ